MLVSHATTCHHQWVLFQVGSWIIDQVVKNIVDKELRSLSQSWNLAYVGTVLSKSLQTGELDKQFDLNQVKGNVIVTKKVTIPAFQSIVVKGLTESHWTLQTCLGITGTIPQVPETFLSWVTPEN